jgi:hypothetical protein
LESFPESKRNGDFFLVIFYIEKENQMMDQGEEDDPEGYVSKFASERLKKIEPIFWD